MVPVDGQEVTPAFLGWALPTPRPEVYNIAIPAGRETSPAAHFVALFFLSPSCALPLLFIKKRSPLSLLILVQKPDHHKRF